MRPSRWTLAQVEAGSWIRRMFAEGQRLRALHGPDSVADLALGQPLEAPPAIREAFVRAATDAPPGRFQYMPNAGYPEVRERIVQEIGFPGLGIDSVALTTGAAGAISVALKTFVQPGDEVVGITPYFSEFRLYCETAGLRFVPVPSHDDLTIDAPAVRAALSDRTAAVIINTPSNPSGHVMSEGELRRLIAALETHNRRGHRRILLIVDEVYRRLIYPPAQQVDVLRLYEHTVLARSFSKDMGIAGERIGYLVLHPSLSTPDVVNGVSLCMRALGYVNAPATAQRALLHLESWDVDCSPHRALRDEAYSAALEAGLDLLEPEGALYLWAHSPWEDTVAFVHALAERRVLITPGVAFGAPDRVRLCFSVPRRSLAMAMEVVAEVLRDGGGKGGIRTPGGA